MYSHVQIRITTPEMMNFLNYLKLLSCTSLLSIVLTVIACGERDMLLDMQAYTKTKFLLLSRNALCCYL